jgi:hypothetical protein
MPIRVLQGPRWPPSGAPDYKVSDLGSVLASSLMDDALLVWLIPEEDSRGRPGVASLVGSRDSKNPDGPARARWPGSSLDSQFHGPAAC